jgi:vacuolar-type H+-ATPase subunit F/Vma7
MSVKHLDIAVIGDEELVNAMRLAGISKYYMVHGDQDARENVRKTLTELPDESG